MTDEVESLSIEESIELTAQNLEAYLGNYENVFFTFSGGKDSTAAVIIAEHLFFTGRLKRPKKLGCLFADTRIEMPPILESAKATMTELTRRGWDCRTAVAPMDKRFLVYILGRGVCPPSNSFRWCTEKIKLNPMSELLNEERAKLKAGEKMLLCTGVRLGESAIRDERIAKSCSKNGSECGQGWYQELTGKQTDTLAPILHWRVCRIWEVLEFFAPSWGFPAASTLSQAYGGEEKLEKNYRTGCIGCPLVTRDLALEGIISMPGWEYLAPLAKLKPIYTDLRENKAGRIRKPGIEPRKTKTLLTKRIGPLKFETRKAALAKILAIQEEVNTAARMLGCAEIDILNAEEVARIEELIELKTWPNAWDGDEPNGDALVPTYYEDGSIQNVLFT